MPMKATQIIRGLFLGTREDAEALGSRVPDDWACISVTEYRSRYKRTEELPNEPDGSLDMPFMTNDSDGWHADRHKLDLIAETIWWRLHGGKKVLVHCIKGQERSPVAVAWYLAWAGEAVSFAHAYDSVARLHSRTERRDKWLRGSLPSKPQPELIGLLMAARTLSQTSDVDVELRKHAIATLEKAAMAWAASGVIATSTERVADNDSRRNAHSRSRAALRLTAGQDPKRKDP